jgi:hypothetical protein
MTTGRINQVIVITLDQLIQFNVHWASRGNNNTVSLRMNS